MDMGFSAVWFFEKCLKKSVNFIGRIQTSWKPEVLRVFGPGDYLVRVKVAKSKRLRGAGPRSQLVLRMITYQVGSDPPVRLITDLLDPDLVPATHIALLYHERWESELTFDEQKVHLIPLQHGKQKTVFRCKTPCAVLQELYGMFIVHNLFEG